MRHKNLIISSLLALVGIFAYFISIPNVDEDSLVKVKVEAGDETLLNDLYFNGSIYDYGSFQINKDGIETREQLSYLEKLDTPSNPTLSIFQQQYPEFMNGFLHGSSIADFYLLNSGGHLISGDFRFGENSYYIDYSTVYFSAIDKETNKLVADKVNRGKVKEGDHISVIGMYEEYPVIKAIYHTDIWTQNTNEDTSILTIAEYNFETKTYTEETIENMEGDFYAYSFNPHGADNNQLQIITHNSLKNGGVNTPSYYVYNYADNTFTPLEESNRHYFVENGQLYSLEGDGQKYVLKTYNQKGDKVVQETNLDVEIPLMLMTDYPLLNTEIIDNRLYIVQSQLTDSAIDVQPTPFQVLNIESGESLLMGEIQFNPESKVNATEVIIDEIGNISEL